ncbi:hypothetical protein [Ileibacterium valens]|uniref:hypothetical protein n=1 Tax=Ileibacterium valens TaxID=1862668 RepID=UPI002731D253|nr:hypothetical protein [Ileibacterium valens]
MNSQTRATAKYRKNAGILSKTIRIPKVLNDEFVVACKTLNILQSSVFINAMKRIIEEAKNVQ